MADLSPQDLDMAARTLIGEAGQEPYLGKAGVAAVILNRLNSGRWGDSVANVVLAPKQFTTWQDRPRELAAISPQSQAYQDAYNVVRDVANGDTPDPTNGAMNYANVDQVQRAGNTSAMKWIRGMSNVSKIGSHTFGNAEGMPVANNFDDDKAFLKSFGKATTPATPEATSNFEADKDFLKSYSTPSAAPPASGYQNTPSNIPVPEANMTPEQKADFEKSLVRPKTPLQQFRESIELPIDPIAATKTAASTTLDKAAQSWNAGLSQTVNPNILPTFETYPSKVTTFTGNEEPATGVRMSDPGKVLGVLGGIAGVATSPLSAAEQGIESVTGNPDFAQKVVELAPLGKLGKLVTDVRPTVQALKRVDEILPPEALAAAERNPSLAPVDVSEQARKRADMIATDALAPRAQQAVLDFVDQRKGELKGDVQSAVETLGELPTPFDVVKQIQQRARDTGAKVINPIVQKAQPADITGVVNGIDDVISKAEKSKLPLSDYQRRLVELRDDLRGDLPDEGQMFANVAGDQGVHGIQWRLRAEAQNLLSSSSGSDRVLGGKLMDWRNKLVDAIDTAAPGYKDALSKFRTDKDVADAFDKGLNISQMPGKSSESILEHSGEGWQDWVKDPNTHPDELSSARLGALSWMAHELEGVKAGKKLLDTPKNPILQDKLEALFGKDKATQYTDLLEDTNNRAKSAQIGGNSATFGRMREAEASPIRVPGKSNSSQATLQSLFPLAAGAVAESLPVLAGVHGWPSALGLGLGVARGGYGIAKHVVEQARYKSDLARRLAEARRLTTPFAKQPDLIAYMRSRRELPRPGDKLRNLLALPLPR